MTTTITARIQELLRRRVQVDRSGVGHAWTAIDADSCPAHICQEIESEIIDGGHASHDGYRATNGLYYRWAGQVARGVREGD